MIAEALKLLAQSAVKAEKPELVHKTADKSIYLLPGGQEIQVEMPAAPREHDVRGLDDLMRLATRFDQDNYPVVWYSQDQVTLVIDDDGHRVERATMDLQFSDVFNVAIALRQQKTWHEPKKFVRLLKIELAGTLDPAALLNAVRKVKFENGQTLAVETARNRESLGKTITAHLDVELPEQVTLTLPVFKTPGVAWTFPLRCTVESDPMEGKFQLLPFPDEIERVVQMAVSGIAAALANGLPESVPAYHGKPE